MGSGEYERGSMWGLAIGNEAEFCIQNTNRIEPEKKTFPEDWGPCSEAGKDFKSTANTTLSTQLIAISICLCISHLIKEEQIWNQTET